MRAVLLSIYIPLCLKKWLLFGLLSKYEKEVFSLDLAIAL